MGKILKKVNIDQVLRSTTQEIPENNFSIVRHFILICADVNVPPGECVTSFSFPILEL